MRQCRYRLYWIFAHLLAASFVLQFQSMGYGEDKPLISAESTSAFRADVQPVFVTLSVSPSVSVDMEMIQWPDGGFSLPVKAFCALFGIEAQQLPEAHRIFFLDPQIQKTVEINWEQQKITIGEQAVPLGSHPVVRSQQGLLIEDDVYIDAATFSSVFGADFKLDRETGTLTMTTARTLKVPGSEDAGLGQNAQASNIRLISNPEVRQALVDKIYIQHATNYAF